jgi:hypothetical protein
MIQGLKGKKNNEQHHKLNWITFLIGTSTCALFSFVTLVVEFYKRLQSNILKKEKKVIVRIFDFLFKKRKKYIRIPIG